MSDKWDTVPGEGQVWVCAACGKIGRGRRMDMGDDSCVMWARLCWEKSLVMGDRGTALIADAVDEAKP